MSLSEEQIQFFREQFGCGFKEIDNVFGDCINEAFRLLTPQGLKDYLDGAAMCCMIGRGVDPVLSYLEEMPTVAAKLGEDTLELVSRTVWRLSRSANGAAIPPFLNTIAEVARRLHSWEQVEHYIDILMGLANRTSGSVHNNQSAPYPSPGLPEFLEKAPYLTGQLSIEGLRNWVDYGVLHYSTHPERQREYFQLQSADARAILQRERHGTLFADHERKLDLYLRALWETKDHLVPYSEGWDEINKAQPYFDEQGIRMPDVYDDYSSERGDVKGIDRYRALLAHVAAHMRWTDRIVADNYSPFQRVAIETFEDSRVEHLAMREYPGLRKLFLSLHPKPGEDDCDPAKESCIRHRLAMFSYAVLDPDHGYTNPDLLEFVEKFREVLADENNGTAQLAPIAISYIARTRRQADQAATVYFSDTEVSYRDDNRHMWVYLEENDEPDDLEAPRKTQEEESDVDGLPPRHYQEWDYPTQTYRPDWVTLYERLHPSGDGGKIDALLSKHEALAKRLKAILDLLKPQNYVRVRYQEEGSELDLDVAIRSLIDFKSGHTPDPRINMHHRNDGRDIAVMLLLDLSESVDQIPDGCSQSILQLSQEAVALLGWAVDKLGDEFSIAGFSSNTRHEVRYQHIKGFQEPWDDTVKGRLAAMEAGWSTRMGGAMRHAAHYLGARKADKKLMLVLTDGEPADIDVNDERLLIEDTRKAVQELDQEGIYTYCINLDPKADEYVRDIFGNQYTVIDKVERLPEKLPQLFMALTK